MISFGEESLKNKTVSFLSVNRTDRFGIIGAVDWIEDNGAYRKEIRFSESSSNE
jgi:hypothetical protein